MSTTGQTALPAVNVLGVDITPFASREQAAECIAQAMRRQHKSFWVAINPLKVHRARRDAALRAALARCDIGLCDGVGIALAGRLLHGLKIPRCTGCDLFFHALGQAERNGWRVYLLGASTETNAAAVRRVRRDYPDLQLAGACDGYFADSADVVGRINDSGAEMLFVAMGSPRQEIWIAENIDALTARFFMGVGGTFDVAAGRCRRAPRICRATGTEFLYRLATQPGRWRSQLALASFAAGVLGRRFLGPPRTGPAGRG
jgi:N-acetylglucosaminyldiphosphoundecaprenol N-acetyl-beta-D-mannosaminyltransferase